MNRLEAFFIFLPIVLQKSLYPISESLAQLNPTTTELSVLFAFDIVDRIKTFIRFSMIVVILWLIFYKQVNKILMNYIRLTPRRYLEQIKSSWNSSRVLNIKKYNLSIPSSILLASLILGGFFYASQISKQRSIEKQQQLELQIKKEDAQTKNEQYRKEYLVKRKADCYKIETSERKKFSNVDGSFYDEENDVCKVRYINPAWTEKDPNACNGLLDTNCTIQKYTIEEF